MNEKCEMSLGRKSAIFLLFLIKIGLLIWLLSVLETGVHYIGLIYF